MRNINNKLITILEKYFNLDVINIIIYHLSAMNIQHIVRIYLTIRNKAAFTIQNIWRQRNIIGNIVHLSWTTNYDNMRHIIVKFARITNYISGQYIGYLYTWTDEGMKNISNGKLTIFDPHARTRLWF